MHSPSSGCSNGGSPTSFQCPGLGLGLGLGSVGLLTTALSCAQEFLRAMEAAGRRAQYEDRIKGEIAEQLRTLQRLGVDTKPGRRR